MTKQSDSKQDPKRRWQAPVLDELPKLSELTLATGPGIPGESNVVGSTGSTVIP